MFVSLINEGSVCPFISTCGPVVQIFLLLFPCFTEPFRVSCPVNYVVAVHGRPTVLGCAFDPAPEPNLVSLVITWQRQEDSRVVHSFYHRKDQLETQSSDYQNRTALFYSNLVKGNASLQITEVGRSDMGWYQCTVSSSQGVDKAQLQLVYGAFYAEPRLSIMVTPSGVTLLFESEGFPEPEVSWQGQQGANSTELFYKEGSSGLLSMRSNYTSKNLHLNVTFTLTNRLLNQDLHRTVSFSHGGENVHRGGNAALLTGVLLVLALNGLSAAQ